MRHRLLVASLLTLAPALAHAGYTEGPVVRPPLYTSSNKFEIAPAVGYVTNDPYNRIIVPGVLLTWHYNDRSAMEAHVGTCMFSPKQLLSQVHAKIGRDPDVISRPKFFVTGNYAWTPVYGKLNAFGELMLHYDLYVVGGLGIVSDEIETNSTATPSVQSIANKVFPVTDVGIGQRFFFSKRTALRVELRPYIFWEQINNKWDPNGDVQILFAFSLLL